MDSRENLVDVSTTAAAISLPDAGSAAPAAPPSTSCGQGTDYDLLAGIALILWPEHLRLAIAYMPSLHRMTPMFATTIAPTLNIPQTHDSMMLLLEAAERFLDETQETTARDAEAQS